MATLEIPLVIGTYAKLKTPASANDKEPEKFLWSCVVQVGIETGVKVSQIIEKVEFRLHNSFVNVCRGPCSKNVSVAYPCLIHPSIPYNGRRLGRVPH